MESMCEYLVPVMREYGLTLQDVTDHRTVAPGRKDDLRPIELERFLRFLSKRL
jgi:N-acetyl-anhydromuramyl-L-alanine amidase AmpD